ncbi:hypothetical protein AAFF_G00138380 [Aldrovandia affinis]|uniref:Uncharacterized protein n=1 Tax=Aldrovandia affinis TaxID=143900 RepID=A0AAD7TBZ1_9TELE|nr:hypothetical protein AAFF_G00138380 [Aldrovandia affinis]
MRRVQSRYSGQAVGIALERCRSVQLNGEPLVMLDDETFPELKPRTLRAGRTIAMPPMAIGFYEQEEIVSLQNRPKVWHVWHVAADTVSEPSLEMDTLQRRNSPPYFLEAPFALLSEFVPAHPPPSPWGGQPNVFPIWGSQPGQLGSAFKGPMLEGSEREPIRRARGCTGPHRCSQQLGAGFVVAGESIVLSGQYERGNGFKERQIGGNVEVTMKCLLVASESAEVLFYWTDPEFEQSIQEQYGATHEAGQKPPALEDSINTRFAPIIISCSSMIDRIDDCYTSFITESNHIYVIHQFDECLYIAVNGDGDEKEEDLRRKIYVMKKLTEVHFGMVTLSSTLLKRELRPQDTDQRNRLWKKLQGLLGTYSRLREEDQSFLVEAVERLIHPTLCEQCIEFLERRLVHQINNSAERAGEEVLHAFILVHTKLLAFYSSRNASTLTSSDLLALILMVQNRYPNSSDLEDPAPEDVENTSVPEVFYTPEPSPTEGVSGACTGEGSHTPIFQFVDPDIQMAEDSLQALEFPPPDPATPSRVFLEATVKEGYCPMMPHSMYCLQLWPSITLVLLTKIPYSQVAISVYFFLDTFTNLEKRLNEGQEGASAPRSPLPLQDLRSKLDKFIRALSGSDVQTSHLQSVWAEFKIKAFSRGGPGISKGLLPWCRSMKTQLCGVYRQCFVMGSGENTQRLAPGLQERAQTMVQEKLMDWKDFLLVKSKRNITMVSYPVRLILCVGAFPLTSILTYLEEFPGLIHFIYVDRTAGQMIAPSLNVTDRSTSELGKGPLAQFIKGKVWSLVGTARRYLQKGYTTATLRDGDYYFCYFLWFENETGYKLDVIDLPILPDDSAPIGMLAWDYYRKLLRYYSKYHHSEVIKCYELLTVHLGVIPSEYVLQHCCQLARKLLPTVARGSISGCASPALGRSPVRGGDWLSAPGGVGREIWHKLAEKRGGRPCKYRWCPCEVVHYLRRDQFPQKDLLHADVMHHLCLHGVHVQRLVVMQWSFGVLQVVAKPSQADLITQLQCHDNRAGSQELGEMDLSLLLGVRLQRQASLQHDIRVQDPEILWLKRNGFHHIPPEPQLRPPYECSPDNDIILVDMGAQTAPVQDTPTPDHDASAAGPSPELGRRAVLGQHPQSLGCPLLAALKTQGRGLPPGRVPFLQERRDPRYCSWGYGVHSYRVVNKSPKRSLPAMVLNGVDSFHLTSSCHQAVECVKNMSLDLRREIMYLGGTESLSELRKWRRTKKAPSAGTVLEVPVMGPVDAADFLKAAAQGRTKVIEKFLKDGGNPDTCDKFRRTALHRAALEGHMAIVQKLLDKGADLNFKDRLDCTAVHWACRGGWLTILKVLQHGGADLKVKDKLMSTPLHVATRTGHYDVVEHLLSSGSEINDKDWEGDTALHDAVRLNRYKIEGMTVMEQVKQWQFDTKEILERLAHMKDMGQVWEVEIGVQQGGPSDGSLALGQGWTLIEQEVCSTMG